MKDMSGSAVVVMADRSLAVAGRLKQQSAENFSREISVRISSGKVSLSVDRIAWFSSDTRW